MAIRRITIPDSDALVVGGATSELMGVLGGVADLSDAVKAFYEGTIVDTREFSMMFVEDRTYHLALNTPFAMEITSVTTDCDSGTCTATVKINGTSLGGTANSVSTTEQTQAHTTANQAVAGDDVTVVISSNSSCEGMRLSMKFNRPLIV